MATPFLDITECPKCSHKESWSTWIGEQGHHMGMCHRAQCGHVTRLSVYPCPTKATPKGREPRHYTRPYKPLTDDQAAIIDSRFGLPADAIDGYSEVDDRFILSVTDVTFGVRGHIAYSLSGGKPKSLPYNGKPEEPFVHWATNHSPKAVVLVEDWFSAEKVREAGLAHGVALMGTNLTQAAVTEVAAVADRWQIPTYIAFDRDAFSKGLSYQIRFKAQFKYGLYVWALLKDLKYESVGRINDAITNRTFNFSQSDRGQSSV